MDKNTHSIKLRVASVLIALIITGAVASIYPLEAQKGPYIIRNCPETAICRSDPSKTYRTLWFALPKVISGELVIRNESLTRKETVSSGSLVQLSLISIALGISSGTLLYLLILPKIFRK